MSRVFPRCYAPAIPVAHRSSMDAPWGTPVHLPEPINSAADNFCPTPVRGNGLFFVSPFLGLQRAKVDVAVGRTAASRFPPGWTAPRHLGCGPAGPNSTLDEMGPSYVETDGHAVLYFSSAPDIYVSDETDMDILLIAGLSLDGSAWADVVSEHEPLGHRPVPLTLPGQGDGSTSATLDDQAATVVAAVDSASEKPKRPHCGEAWLYRPNRNRLA